MKRMIGIIFLTLLSLGIAGAQNLSVTPELDFGTTFTVSTTTGFILIENNSESSINISNYSLNHPFYLESGPDFLPGFSSDTVFVQFISETADTFSDTLMISADATYKVALTGTKVEPPAIEVAPESFDITINTFDTTNQNLYISNNGSSDLEYNLSAELTENQSESFKQFVRSNFIESSYKTQSDDQIHPMSRLQTDFNVQAIGESIALQTSGDILLIGDGGTENTLKPLLEGAGYSVVLVGDDTQYTGSNPSPEGFSTVVLTDGISYGGSMPVDGQLALVNFVNNGGGFIYTSWLEYEVDNGRYSSMTDLVITTRSGGHATSDTYTKAIEHPILDGVNFPITVGTGGNIGPANAGTVIVNGSVSGAGVVVHEYGEGRIVGFASAGNYNGYNPFANPEMALLFLNAVKWSGAQLPFLSFDQITGTVEAGQTDTIKAEFVGPLSVPEGIYEGNILVESNDPETPVQSVPFSVSLIGVPQISVDDSVNLVSVFTLENATAEIIVRNTGNAALLVSSVSVEDGPFSVSPNEFTLAPFGFDTLYVVFNSEVDGDFNRTLTIENNDETKTIELYGKALARSPKVVITVDSLQFIPIFEGDTTGLPLVIGNTGTQPLEVLAFNFDIPQFFTSVETLVVPAGTQDTVMIYFSADTPNQYVGQVTVETNDADSVILLKGQATVGLTVTPEDITVNLVNGDTSSFNITLNHGYVDSLRFFFSTARLVAPLSDNSESKALNSTWDVGPLSDQPAAGIAQETPINFNSITSETNEVTVNSEGLKVLILHGDGSNSQYTKAGLLMTGRFFENDIVLLENTSELTLEYLLEFDAVLAYANSAIANSDYVGNLLKDYVDNGGGVVIATYSLSTSWRLTGGIFDPYYSPFIPTLSQSVSGVIDFESLLFPNHPVFQGIEEAPQYWWNSNYSNPDLNEGGIVLAYDTYGNKVVAENIYGNVMGIVIFPGFMANPSYINAYNDASRLMFANALYYVAGKSGRVASFTPNDAWIQPNETFNVGLDLIGSPRVAEGHYNPDVLITVNEPFKKTVRIPVDYTLTGTADLSAPDTLDLGDIVTNDSTIISVRIRNAGNAPLSISSMTTDNESFVLTEVPDGLAPFEGYTVVMSFTPTEIGLYMTTMTIESTGGNRTVVIKANVIGSSVSVTDNLTGIPEEYELRQNYPNPFNPQTTIVYGLPQAAKVKLTIYNALGQEVKTLVNQSQSAGFKTIVWNGENNQGQTVSTGVYLYKLQTDNKIITKKMVYLK